MKTKLLFYANLPCDLFLTNNAEKRTRVIEFRKKDLCV